MEKTIKKIYTYGLVLLVASFSISCDENFLETIPNNQLSAGSFWSNEADAQAGLTAVYDNLESPRGTLGWASLGLFDLLTPIGNSRDGSIRAVAQGTHDSGSGVARNLWNRAYRGVVRANDLIVNVENIEFTGTDGQDRKNLIVAEGRFLRAMFYYLLVEQFGDVPLFTTVPTVDDAGAIRNPKSEVLQLMKGDVDFAINNLKTKADTQTGRATIGAALMLKAKIALYEKDWDTAASTTQQVMGLGYGLVPDYGDVISIDNENNEEVIFDVEHVFLNEAERGGSVEKLYAFRSSAASGWTWVQPTMWLVDQYERIIPNPQEGVDYVNEDPGRIPNEVYEYFEGRDPRMDHTIIRAGARFLDKVNNNILYPHQFQAINHSQVGMHMRKYVIPGEGTSANNDSPLDYVIFRYADALLMYAEALARQGTPDNINLQDAIPASKLSQAVLDQTVNAVRNRASGQLPAYVAGAITYEDLYKERIRELAMEGWTYFDMKRSGMIEINSGFEVRGFTVRAGTSIDFNPNVINNVRIFDPATHYLFPIPNGELERGTNLSEDDQNPGYQ